MRALLLALTAALVLAALPAAGYEPKPEERSLYLPAGPAQAAAYERALALLDQDDFRGAVAAFDEVLRLQPEFAVARSYRASTYLELGEVEQAIAEHDAVLRVAPNRPGSWTNSCWARAFANVDLQGAIKLCDRAVEMGGGWNAYDSRGFAHFKQGAYQAAIDDYTRAIKLNRGCGSAWFMRGVAKLRMGDEKAGRKDIAWAVKSNPKIQATYARWGVQP